MSAIPFDMVAPSYREYVMAVERVERRLRRVAAALEQAGVPHAIVGGNAVAAWVARVDPAATRATKDVDILVRRADVDRVTQALGALGFERQNLRDMVLFVDPEEPSRRSGVHLVWANERIRPSYPVASPDVDESVADASGFRVLQLHALVRMKLTSFRDIDRVHIGDLLSVDLIDDHIRAALPLVLQGRLREIEEGLEQQ
jgi:hypothetical protein